MKKSIITTIIALMAMVAMASPVSKQQARQQAQTFFSERGIAIVGEPRRAPGQHVAADNQPLYVFNAAASKGFVIVAGDDRAAPILGYVDEGCYDEQSLPDNFRSWIMLMADEISRLPREDAMQPSSSSSPLFVSTHAAISPLIKTKWNQGSATEEGYIYNEQTPTIDGKHCLTGCVATAGAQIMFYYKHPQKSTKSVPAYTPNTTIGQLPALPATTFEWSIMKNSYSGDDVNTSASAAVSKLMKYCGWAAEMDYGLEGSGAGETVLAESMVEFFDYDSGWKCLNRDNYSVSDWDALIYSELQAGRPVLYSGQAWIGSGHAFICDGYDGAGLYHFNWGWGGSYNGYFKLHATNPTPTDMYSNGTFDSGYILGASAIIGLQPNTGTPVVDDENDSWDEPVPDGIVATVFDKEIDGTKIVLGMGNDNDGSYGFGYGMGELKTNGAITMVDKKYEYMTSSVLDKYSYYPNRTFDTSTYGLANGKHKLVPMSLLAGETAWKRCKPLDMYFEVTVSNGIVTSIVEHPVVNLMATDLVCSGGKQPNMRQTLTFKVKNNGDNYKGALYLFASKSTEKGGYCGYSYIRIKAGNTKERYMTFTPTDVGTYNLWIATDFDGHNVIGQTTVKIAQSLQLSKITFPGNKVATIKQPVVASVKSTAGDYTQPLYLFANTTSANKGNAIYCAAAGIEKGQTEDVTFYFRPATAGNYQIWICTDKDGQNVLGMGSVTIINPPTGEVKLEASNRQYVTGQTTTMTMTVKNAGTVPYYETVWTLLYKKTGSQWEYNVYEETAPLTISAGASITVTHVFKDLEPGDYMVSSNYSPSFGSDGAKSLGVGYFTVTAGSVPTLIETVMESQDSTTWFTLGGQRLTTPPTAPGIYLKNGRKVVVK